MNIPSFVVIHTAIAIAITTVAINKNFFLSIWQMQYHNESMIGHPLLPRSV